MNHEEDSVRDAATFGVALVIVGPLFCLILEAATQWLL
jgi:hypothetical protein